MWKPLLNLYQRYAAQKIFTRWSPVYDDEVAVLSYSAADQVAAATLRHIPGSSVEEPLHIADIGIGTGLLAQQIWEAVPCLIAGLDFSEDMMAICSQKEVAELLIKCDVGRDHWPLQEDAYDVVMASGLFEYLTPPMVQHFLKETTRLLKPGGLVIFSYIPSEQENGSYTIWPGRNGRFVRCEYTPAKLEADVVAKGFKILEHKEPFDGSVFADGSSFSYRLIVAQKLAA